jgi:hypothetical protein
MAYETLAKTQITEAEVISSIEDFLFGDGDYLEREHRLLARKCGLKEEKIAGLWHNAAEQARQNLATMQARFGEVAGRFEALRPKIEEAKSKLAESKQVEPEASPPPAFRRYPATNFFGPTTQPTDESTGKDTATRKAGAAKIVRDELARPKKEPEEPGTEKAEEPAKKANELVSVEAAYRQH